MPAESFLDELEQHNPQVNLSTDMWNIFQFYGNFDENFDSNRFKALIRNRIVVLHCMIIIECVKKLIYLKQSIADKFDIESQNGM